MTKAELQKELRQVSSSEVHRAVLLAYADELLELFVKYYTQEVERAKAKTALEVKERLVKHFGLEDRLYKPEYAPDDLSNVVPPAQQEKP